MAKDREKIKFAITNELGIVSQSKTGWNIEFNRVMWNDEDPKYDIRKWAPDHEKAGKGITLTEEELRKLKELIDVEISLLDADVYKAGLSK